MTVPGIFSPRFSTIRKKPAFLLLSLLQKKDSALLKFSERDDHQGRLFWCGTMGMILLFPWFGKKFDKNLIKSPIMHVGELKSMKKAYETEWISTTDKSMRLL